MCLNYFNYLSWKFRITVHFFENFSLPGIIGGIPGGGGHGRLPHHFFPERSFFTSQSGCFCYRNTNWNWQSYASDT